MKQNWMNADILQKMEERRLCKIREDVRQYKRLNQEIRRMCREAKDRYYEDKCKEIEMLDIVHSQLLYQKIKDIRPKGSRALQTIKSKQGQKLIEKEEVLDRWAEYVEDLYKDENRGEADVDDSSDEVYTVSGNETEAVIKDLPKGKAAAISQQNFCKAWG